MRTKMYEVIDVTFHASEEAAREAQAGGATAGRMPNPARAGSGARNGGFGSLTGSRD